MNSQAQELYIRTQISTAPPEKLTLMLYNGCIKFMKVAMEGIENKNYELKNTYIQKSQDILNELLITLNMEYEISHTLFNLYEFIKEKLVEANTKLNIDSLKVCIELVSELRDTWVEAIKLVKKNGSMTG